MRSWLARNAGYLCIAFGWVFAFAAVFVPKTADFAATIMELGLAGSACFGFGVGWIVRGEGGDRREGD